MPVLYISLCQFALPCLLCDFSFLLLSVSFIPFLNIFRGAFGLGV